MDHERLERFEYFGGIDGKDSLSLLLVIVDQSCCHFVSTDRLRCILISDGGSGMMVSGRFSIAAAAMPSTRSLSAYV